MDKLKTAPGKEFDCDSFNFAPTLNRAYIRVSHLSLVTAAEVFSNPAETVQLWYGDQYLSQYTTLLSIKPEGNAIRIALRKE